MGLLTTDNFSIDNSRVRMNDWRDFKALPVRSPHREGWFSFFILHNTPNAECRRLKMLFQAQILLLPNYFESSVQTETKWLPVAVEICFSLHCAKPHMHHLPSSPPCNICNVSVIKYWIKMSGIDMVKQGIFQTRTFINRAYLPGFPLILEEPSLDATKWGNIKPGLAAMQVSTERFKPLRRVCLPSSNYVDTRL